MADKGLDQFQRVRQERKIRNASKPRPQQDNSEYQEPQPVLVQPQISPQKQSPANKPKHQKLVKPIQIIPQVSPHNQSQKQPQQQNQQLPQQQPKPDQPKHHKLLKPIMVIPPHQHTQKQPQKHRAQQHQTKPKHPTQTQPRHSHQAKNKTVLILPHVQSKSSPRQQQPQPNQKQEQQPNEENQEDAVGSYNSYVSNTSTRKDLIGTVVGGRYRIRTRIGNGSFGELYRAVNLRDGEEAAVKLECCDTKYPMLIQEARIYHQLQGGVGFPKMHHYGIEGEYNVLVIDLLGASLEELFNLCSRRFSTKTTLMLADQILDRMEFVHLRCIIHRDIKPDNFLMGLGRHRTQVFMIDFGLAKKYYSSRKNTHISYTENHDLVGTARYSSIRAHYAEQSRRDDLEAIGYMLLYFQRGRLPWQGIRAQTQAQKYEKIAESKSALPLNVLCSGLSIEFFLYLRYCRNLKFQEDPDYGYLRHLFKSLYRINFLFYDFLYDWMCPYRERKRLELAIRKREARANDRYHGWDCPLIALRNASNIKEDFKNPHKAKEQCNRECERCHERCDTDSGRSKERNRAGRRDTDRNRFKYNNGDNDIDQDIDRKRDKENKDIERDRYLDRGRFGNREEDTDKNRDTDRDRNRDRYRTRATDRKNERCRSRDRCQYGDRDISADNERDRVTDRFKNRENYRYRDTTGDRDKSGNKDTDRYKDRGKIRDRERTVSRDKHKTKDKERGGDRSRERDRSRNLENARSSDRNRHKDRHRDIERNRERYRTRDQEKDINKERYRCKDRDKCRCKECDRDKARDKERDRDRVKYKDRVRNRDRERVKDMDRKNERDRKRTSRDIHHTTRNRRAFSYDSKRFPKPLGDHQVKMYTERRRHPVPGGKRDFDA